MEKKYDLLKVINVADEGIGSYKKINESYPMVRSMQPNDCSDYKVTNVNLEGKNSHGWEV